MANTSIDIRETLFLISQDDQTAFSRLFEFFSPNIYTTALQLTDDDWVAEEIVQDSFLKVWLNRSSLTTIENFEGWLHTVARNLIFDALKKDRRDKQALINNMEESLIPLFGENDYFDKEEMFQKLLEEAILRLPPKQRETFEFIKVKLLKRKDVATKLNVSQETVKWNLDQAMKSIRAYCMANMRELPIILVLLWKSKFL